MRVATRSDGRAGRGDVLTTDVGHCREATTDEGCGNHGCGLRCGHGCGLQRSRMWAANRLRKRDRVSPWGWLQKVTGSRGKDATQLNQKVLGVCVLRRFKSLCESEVEAPWIAGTDLWAS